MGILTITICFGFSILAVVLYKSIMNPQTLFCGFIGLIVFLSSLRLYGLSETSTLTFVIIISGIVAYSGGAYLATRVKKIPVKISNITFDYEENHYTLRKKFIFFLAAFLLLFAVYRMFSLVIPMLRSGYSLDTVRMIYFGGEYQEYSYSRLDSIIEMFINLPFLYAFIPVVAIEITKEKDKRELNKSTLIMLLIWMGLSCIISGGRALIYNLAVVIVAAFIFSKKKKKHTTPRKKNIKRNVIVTIIIIGIVYMMYLLSIHRSRDAVYEFAYQLYIYFCGSVPHMSLRLNTINIEYTYGLTLVSGFLRPFMLVYKYLLGNGQFPELYQRTINIGATLQSAVTISSGHTYNAFVLPFYYFFVDGHLLGVIIDSFFYGVFCSRAYYHFKRNKTKITEAKYLLVIILIATSMVRYNLGLVYFAFAYIYINFLFKKQKNDSLDEVV